MFFEIIRYQIVENSWVDTPNLCGFVFSNIFLNLWVSITFILDFNAFFSTEISHLQWFKADEIADFSVRSGMHWGPLIHNKKRKVQQGIYKTQWDKMETNEVNGVNCSLWGWGERRGLKREGFQR